jgi:hypothetical protein
MKQRPASPFNDIAIFTPRISRGNTHNPQTDNRRQQLAIYVATQRWMARMAGRPAVISAEAVANWKMEAWNISED